MFAGLGAGKSKMQNGGEEQYVVVLGVTLVFALFLTALVLGSKKIREFFSRKTTNVVTIVSSHLKINRGSYTAHTAEFFGFFIIVVMVSFITVCMSFIVESMIVSYISDFEFSDSGNESVSREMQLNSRVENLVLIQTWLATIMGFAGAIVAFVSHHNKEGQKQRLVEQHSFNDLNQCFNRLRQLAQNKVNPKIKPDGSIPKDLFNEFWSTAKILAAKLNKHEKIEKKYTVRPLIRQIEEVLFLLRQKKTSMHIETVQVQNGKQRTRHPVDECHFSERESTNLRKMLSKLSRHMTKVRSARGTNL